jgi:cardiolipin synthase
MEIWKQAQTIPNMLTLSRIFGAPVLSYCIVNHMYAEALSGCFIAAFSDYLDGHIARKYPNTQATVLGTYLDPMADKILINVLAVSLCYDGILPGPMVGLWLLKDVGLIVTCYQAVADNTPEGAAVMDPLRTPLKVTPTTISKVNTFLQFTTISLGLLQPTVVMASSLSYLNTLSTILPPPQTLDYLCWTTAGTTVASVLSYVDGASLKMNKKGGGKPPNKNNL